MLLNLKGEGMKNLGIRSRVMDPEDARFVPGLAQAWLVRVLVCL